MERICSDCGKTFEGRADAQFCSDACRIRTRRRQREVASQPAQPVESLTPPAGMVLIAADELAGLRALAAQTQQASVQVQGPELGPELRIDYGRLISYLGDAKDYTRQRHPGLFAQQPFDINDMLDRIFGKGHVRLLPSMTFTVNINLAKSALTPDYDYAPLVANQD